MYLNICQILDQINPNRLFHNSHISHICAAFWSSSSSPIRASTDHAELQLSRWRVPSEAHVPPWYPCDLPPLGKHSSEEVLLVLPEVMQHQNPRRDVGESPPLFGGFNKDTCLPGSVFNWRNSGSGCWCMKKKAPSRRWKLGLRWLTDSWLTSPCKKNSCNTPWMNCNHSATKPFRV